MEKMSNLSQSAIKAMALRVSIIVLLGAIGSYWLNYQNIKTQTLDELEKYVEERADRESAYYSLAEKNMKFVENDFKVQFAKEIPNIDQLFFSNIEQIGNGTYRDIRYRDPNETQVFMKKGTPLTYEIKKVAVVGYDLLSSLGHAWSTNFINVWMYQRDGLTLSYTPSVPHSLHFLSPNFSFLNIESIYIGFPRNNPERVGRWTGAFYDRTLKKWVVSYNRPIYYQNKYLLSFGIDVTLDQLIKRTSKTTLEGSYNLLFNQDGRLISHPKYTDALKKSKGKWYIQKSDDPILKSVFAVTRGDERIYYDPDLKIFIAARKIKGPNWWFAVVYPETNLQLFSRRTAIFVFSIGLISLFLELLIFSQVLKTYVISPIHKLIYATKEIALGKSKSRVIMTAENEIGTLAASFNIMADKVMDRDERLREQAENLSIQVTEQNRELDIQRANAFNAAKMVTLGEFASRIAHEINNPLATISLSTDALLRTNKDEKTFKYLSKSKMAADKISRIVKGMRAFADQSNTNTWKTFSVKDVIDDTLILCEASIRENNIKLQVYDGSDICIHGDKSELSQVLLNLIENSIDALKEVDSRFIDIRVNGKDKSVFLSIEDTGSGIPIEIRDKIMDPFFTTKEIGKGVGLGLFIATGLTHSHGGEIYLDTQSQKTRFVIRLPVSGNAVI